MTGFVDLVVAALLALVLNSIVVWGIRNRLPREDSEFLSRVYARALFLRYGLALFLNAYSGDSSFADTFWGDSGTYDSGGYLLSLSWKGEVLLNPHLQTHLSGYGFFYFVGATYYVFGRNQLLVQFINGTISCVAILLIYAIASSLFDRAAARWAALFMAFFPQMIFWSGAMYKDPAVILCIAACMYSLMRLRERLTVKVLLLFLVACLALMTLRFYVFYFVAFATLGTFLFGQRRSFLGRLLAHVTLLAVFLAAFSFAVGTETLEQHRSYFELERVEVSRADLARSARSGFGREADVSTVTGALRALPVGLLHLLFAPFPWAVRGLRQMLTLPEMIVWYGLMPALVRGLAHAIRHRLGGTLPILVYATSLTVAYSIFLGNVGTVYRQRTQITMFYFIFIGVGLVERGKRKEALFGRA